MDDSLQPGKTMPAARLALMVLLVLLAACAAAPRARDASPGKAAATDAGSDASKPAAAPALVLAGRAVTQLNAGNPEQASATLERALAIDPENAGLWLELGWVRLVQGDDYQAAVLAGRARGLTSDPVLLCRASRLVDAARGRIPDARRARAAAVEACRPEAG